MAICGSKGSFINISQMIACVVSSIDFLRRSSILFRASNLSLGVDRQKVLNFAVCQLFNAMTKVQLHVASSRTRFSQD